MNNYARDGWSMEEHEAGEMAMDDALRAKSASAGETQFELSLTEILADFIALSTSGPTYSISATIIPQECVVQRRSLAKIVAYIRELESRPTP